MTSTGWSGSGYLGDYVAAWGPSQLRKWSLDEAASLHASQQSRDFLTAFGLPRVEVLSRFRFLETPPFIRLAERPSMAQIGEAGCSLLCVDEESDGIVVSYGPGDRIDFMNSSIEQLVISMTILEKYWRDAPGGNLSKPELHRRWDELESRLREVDPRALADDENWLSVEVWEIRNEVIS